MTVLRVVICNACGLEIESRFYTTVNYKWAQGNKVCHYHTQCADVVTQDKAKEQARIGQLNTDAKEIL